MAEKLLDDAVAQRECPDKKVNTSEAKQDDDKHVVKPKGTPDEDAQGTATVEATDEAPEPVDDELNEEPVKSKLVKPDEEPVKSKPVKPVEEPVKPVEEPVEEPVKPDPKPVDEDDDDQLSRMLRERLMMLSNEGDAVEQDEVLSPLSIEGIASFIKDLEKKQGDDKRKIMIMTGAGISTAAGIPDFRSPGTGLYDNLQKYDLPRPTAVFEIAYFRENPKPFCMLAKKLYPGNFLPTLSHYFIKLLADKGLLLRNFTQNIDTLERHAGIGQEFLVEAHGSFAEAHCITCGKEYSEKFVKEAVFSDQVPYCECKGLVKPDIVFFGESLPLRFTKLAAEDTRSCELLVIMGTSLAVQPFAGLAGRVGDKCPRLLINREKVGESNPLMAVLGFGSGLDFSKETGYRDVFLESDCDKGCLQLAKLLGWEEELTKLHHDEHKRLAKEQASAAQGDGDKN